MLVMGGTWSAYWYNGHIYASEIARGLDIFELTPDAASDAERDRRREDGRVDALNVQTQERMEWPKKLVVAKAYIDQLERSQALSSAEIDNIRQAIQKAEGSKSELGKLKGHASTLEKSAATAKNVADAVRLKALAEILRQPSV